MKRPVILLLLICCCVTAFAQRDKANSTAALLAAEKTDTGKINYMWKIASYLYSYAPDSSLRIAQKALFLSQRIGYKEGESRSLGQMANSFLSMGNYPRALEYYLKKLKLEEGGANPYNLASVTMNIGIVYVYREEYEKALVYLKQSDSIITANQFTDLQFNINLNLGDVYYRQDNTDSAFLYFDRSLKIAQQMQDGDLTGTSLTGLGHTYLKAGNQQMSLRSYTEGLAFLEAANNEDFACEAMLGLAKLYQAAGNTDSSVYFGRRSFLLAKKDMFQQRELDAANFLMHTYKASPNKDSAFYYLQEVKDLGDSLNSKDKIRESESISINEELRQNEIAENARRLKEERHQQLQLLLIGLGIPVLFLITLLLSRVKVHVRIIKFLGIISLLILFEYLTLLLHPRVVEITHHTPFLELLIFVVIASLLIPAHHRIEHWLVQKLTYKKDHRLKIKTQRLTIKKTS